MAAWIPAAISAGAGLLGSSMAGKSADKSAKRAAEAQLQAARTAASASAFRPVGMTTRFGTSGFQMGTDQYGTPIVTGASYSPTGEIVGLQDRLAALYAQSLGQAETAAGQAAPLTAAGQGLFSLGQQYMAESPEAARQQYIREQMDILDPIRQREEQRLGASVFGRGRAGLSVGDTGQPELFALANARRTQDLQLAAQAEQAAQQRIGFGAGLFGTGAGLMGTGYQLQTQALSPFQSQFGTTAMLEQQALQPFELGAALGGRNVNTAGASALLQGGLGAAQTQLQGSLVGPSLMANTLSKVNYGDLFNKLMGQQQPAPVTNLSFPSGAFGNYDYTRIGPSGISQADMLAQQNAWFD